MKAACDSNDVPEDCIIHEKCVWKTAYMYVYMCEPRLTLGLELGLGIILEMSYSTHPCAQTVVF
jgi:hypothetical protein